MENEVPGKRQDPGNLFYSLFSICHVPLVILSLRAQGLPCKDFAVAVFGCLFEVRRPIVEAFRGSDLI